jgi:hypothetical protein
LHVLCQLCQLSFTVNFCSTGSKFSANFSKVNSLQLSMGGVKFALCCCNCSLLCPLCGLKFTLSFTIRLALLAVKFTLSRLDFTLCLTQLAARRTLQGCDRKGIELRDNARRDLLCMRCIVCQLHRSEEQKY